MVIVHLCEFALRIEFMCLHFVSHADIYTILINLETKNRVNIPRCHGKMGTPVRV